MGDINHRYSSLLMEKQELLLALSRGDKKAFSILFTAYYKDMVLFAGSFLPESAT